MNENNHAAELRAILRELWQTRVPATHRRDGYDLVVHPDLATRIRAALTAESGDTASADA